MKKEDEIQSQKSSSFFGKYNWIDKGIAFDICIEELFKIWQKTNVDLEKHSPDHKKREVALGKMKKLNETGDRRFFLTKEELSLFEGINNSDYGRVIGWRFNLLPDIFRENISKVHGTWYSYYGSNVHWEEGSDLHIMLSFPETEIKAYRNSYILVGKKLRYITFSGEYEKSDVPIKDIGKFLKDIKPFSCSKQKIELSLYQVKKLITSNGGHTGANGGHTSGKMIKEEKDKNNHRLGFFKPFDFSRGYEPFTASKPGDLVSPYHKDLTTDENGKDKPDDYNLQL